MKKQLILLSLLLFAWALHAQQKQVPYSPNTVQAAPPAGCDPRCTFMLFMGGQPGSTFHCGDVVELDCGQSYDFSPRLDCGSSLIKLKNVSFVSTPGGTTPSWASSFVGSLGNGLLSVPSGVNGTYTVTYYWGNASIPGNICDSCVFKFDIKCPCSQCNFELYVGNLPGGSGSYGCNSHLRFECGREYMFSPHLYCPDGTRISQVTLVSNPGGVTPSWAASFLASGGNGWLYFPPGVSGSYVITYYFMAPDGTICGSCQYFIDVDCVTCPQCKLDLIIPGVTGSPFSCNGTVKLDCNKQYQILPRLTCQPTGAQISQVSLVSSPGGATPSWAAAFIASGGNGSLAIPNGVAGNYTLTYTWSANGKVCASCSYNLVISCCYCEKNVVNNGNMYNIPTWGPGISDIKNTPTSDSWFASSYSPQAYNSDGCCDPGWVAMWGNKIVGEQISQTGRNFIAGHKYRTSFCAKFYGSQKATWVNLRFTASNGVPGPYGAAIPGSTPIGVSAAITNPNWATYTLPDWIAPANYNAISINPENQYSINDGAYVSWALLDNVCITDLCPTYSVSFANPTISSCCVEGGVRLEPVIRDGDDHMTYEWDGPAGGLDNPYILNPIARKAGVYTLSAYTGLGCKGVASVQLVAQSTSCCRITAANKARLSPNPFTSSINVILPAGSNARLVVSTLNGRVLEEKKAVSGSVQVGARLERGVYQLNVIFPDGSTEVHKLIKQ